MKISVIRLVHWCYQGKYIFAKALACRSSSFHLSVSFGPLGHPVCIPLDSCKRVEANSVEQFLKLFTEKVFKKTKQNKKTHQHCCCKEFPELVELFIKEIILQARISLIFQRDLDAQLLSESWSLVTRADSTLFYCSPLLGIHYSLFSQELLPLRGTILSHRSVYVLWISNYIYCHYKGTIK